MPAGRRREARLEVRKGFVGQVLHGNAHLSDSLLIFGRIKNKYMERGRIQLPSLYEPTINGKVENLKEFKVWEECKKKAYHA